MAAGHLYAVTDQRARAAVLAACPGATVVEVANTPDGWRRLMSVARRTGPVFLGWLPDGPITPLPAPGQRVRSGAGWVARWADMRARRQIADVTGHCSPRFEWPLPDGQAPEHPRPPAHLLLPLPDGALACGPARGILTGGRSIHWQCIGALALGAAEHGIGMAVADHGLHPWQRAELERAGAAIVRHEQPDLSVPTAHGNPRSISEPRAWWKPWVCLASPWDRSLWIDADAVLTGDPAAVLAGSRPAVSVQTLWRMEGSRLYRRLAGAVFGDASEAFVGRVARINTGVIAFSRHDPWLWEWAAWSARIAGDPALASLCDVRDQSAAAVSMLWRRANGRRQVGLLDPGWNTPADGLGHADSRLRLPVPAAPAAFLAEARRRHPGAMVVHWLGRPKPWDLMH